jgi:TatD DNase family protein
VVAWGECGLDFYYDNSPRDEQRVAFREQLRLAREAGLPVIIHSRDAADETLAILRDEWHGEPDGGVFHCFSYDLAVAREAAALGMLVSFSGIVTFKTAGAIKEAAAEMPLESILIETDAPFLAPVPHRGARNEPLYVREVAAEIGRLRGLDAAEVGRATAANFRRLFRLG